MTILNQLSSQSGDPTEESNTRVANLCLENPILLKDIIIGLDPNDPLVTGDCLEVLTKVAAIQPNLVSGYVEVLLPYLKHKTTRVRWETAHCLALIANIRSDHLTEQLPLLSKLLKEDKSRIVRDYLVTLLGNYASTSKESAQAVYPTLKGALTIWDGKHAGFALRGLQNVIAETTEFDDEIRGIANEYLDSGRANFRKAARDLIAKLEKH